MAATIQTNSPSVSNAEFGAWVTRAFKRGLLLWDRHRQRRALLDLDSRQLKDIGKTREEVLKEARKPFWK